MAVILSFVIAFLLTLVPVPEWVTMYRPDWVVLVLIYWCLEIPDRDWTRSRLDNRVDGGYYPGKPVGFERPGYDAGRVSRKSISISAAYVPLVAASHFRVFYSGALSGAGGLASGIRFACRSELWLLGALFNRDGSVALDILYSP